MTRAFFGDAVTTLPNVDGKIELGVVAAVDAPIAIPVKEHYVSGGRVADSVTTVAYVDGTIEVDVVATVAAPITIPVKQH